MNSNDVLQAAGKSAPPVAYVSVTLLHISLPDWVAILTGAYILLQAAYLIWKWRRQAQPHSGSGD